MCTILLPIKPKYSKAILTGEKTFELRRSLPKKKVDKVIIYETSPTMKIVGFIEIKKVHSGTKENIWNLTNGKNSVTKEEFYQYFDGKEKAYAMEIKKYKKYKNPVTLSSIGIGYPPQGFIYADQLNVK